MKYILALCLCLGGCATVKGQLDLIRDDNGKLAAVKYESKGTADWEIKEGDTSVGIKTKKIPKPSMLDKVADLATIGLTNRVVNNEENKD